MLVQYSADLHKRQGFLDAGWMRDVWMFRHLSRMELGLVRPSHYVLTFLSAGELEAIGVY